MRVESRDAVVQMRIGERFFGNHQHKDFGTFQIYYRGPLAISSGVYDLYGSEQWGRRRGACRGRGVELVGVSRQGEAAVERSAV